MPWHVGVVGSGGWSRIHLSAFSASPHVERVTLAARNAAAAAKCAEEFPIVRQTFSDPRRLFDDPSIDLISIVLPHHLHAEVAIAALEAGKHVICEKPAAIRVDQLDRVIAAARTQGRRFLVVMNQLYNPVVWRVREIVDSGTLGRIFLSVENSYSNSSRHYRDPNEWRTTVDRSGGGVLIDGGFHMVYRHLYYLHALGKPRQVRATASQLAISADGAEVPDKGEDCFAATVDYDRPLAIQWSHAWTLAAPPSRARQNFLAATEGTLELLDNSESPLELHRPNSAVELPSVEPGPRSGPDTTRVCLMDYLDCLIENRDPVRAVLPLARLTLQVICGVYESAREGRPVKISPEARRPQS